jgi:hypothetical protein
VPLVECPAYQVRHALVSSEEKAKIITDQRLQQIGVGIHQLLSKLKRGTQGRSGLHGRLVQSRFHKLFTRGISASADGLHRDRSLTIDVFNEEIWNFREYRGAGMHPIAIKGSLTICHS